MFSRSMSHISLQLLNERGATLTDEPRRTLVLRVQHLPTDMPLHVRHFPTLVLGVVRSFRFLLAEELACSRRNRWSRLQNRASSVQSTVVQSDVWMPRSLPTLLLALRSGFSGRSASSSSSTNETNYSPDISVFFLSVSF